MGKGGNECREDGTDGKDREGRQEALMSCWALHFMGPAAFCTLIACPFGPRTLHCLRSFQVRALPAGTLLARWAPCWALHTLQVRTRAACLHGALLALEFSSARASLLGCPAGARMLQLHMPFAPHGSEPLAMPRVHRDTTQPSEWMLMGAFRSFRVAALRRFWGAVMPAAPGEW